MRKLLRALVLSSTVLVVERDTNIDSLHADEAADSSGRMAEKPGGAKQREASDGHRSDFSSRLQLATHSSMLSSSPLQQLMLQRCSYCNSMAEHLSGRC